ncbi:uncharacterized protein cubi_00380 [Cryptosporidium ubiquitum]|uniref:Uncharacterized protein n=1 Tax=Cryptosporidium ubiquitum TaxID=857276 RepID=A0A1J4MDU4_9CRYT|nr:uncharacterized protein cubi_00380 [Cryptosporidium ubiquitum]OII72385.1 hypothetical protein cubi_00380 [Cryptosporidium ubiquitum]
MKSIFFHLLLTFLVFSCTYASLFPDLRQLESEIQELNRQFDDFVEKCEKLSGSAHIGENLLIMAIEQGENVMELPLLGSFKSKIQCGHTRLFFFDFDSGLFVVTEVNCKNKVLFVSGVHGKYELIIKDNELLRKEAKNKSNILVETNFVCTTNTYNLKQISSCPSYLKNFDKNMIPKNFNIKTDQSPLSTNDLSHRGFYFTNSRKDQKTDSRTELTYALFSSDPLKYAIPIQEGCECTVENSKILLCVCDGFSYKFDVENSFLVVGPVKLLTNNVYGLKVLTANTNTELLSNIDITTQEQNEAKLETQL